MVKPIIIESSDANVVLLHEAARWVGTMEQGGDNSGPDVERFQRALDGKASKEPWCAAFIMFCIKEVESKLSTQSKIYKSELVLDVWNKSSPECRQIFPRPGTLVLWRHENSISGHMGIIETVHDNGFITTIEGNTGPGMNVVREGDGVYRKLRTVYGTQKMPVLGFLKAF